MQPNHNVMETPKFNKLVFIPHRKIKGRSEVITTAINGSKLKIIRKEFDDRIYYDIFVYYSTSPNRINISIYFASASTIEEMLP